MSKRGLLIGIDKYDHLSALSGCVRDARTVADTLATNEDGSANYGCKVLLSDSGDPVTRALLRQNLEELFDSFDGDVFFYFSGHGSPSAVGGYLVTQDGKLPGDVGVPMNDLLAFANQSKARSVLLVLDCCFSGSLGNPPNIQAQGALDQAQLREGVTVLAASRPTQVAMEVGGRGVFTELFIGALQGGAADVRGRVSAASIYAYVEAALGPWDQRPLYKSHASRLEPVRVCSPKISDQLLRELPQLFAKPDDHFRIDPTFEETELVANSSHVAIFKKFKKLQIAGLLQNFSGKRSLLDCLEVG